MVLGLQGTENREVLRGPVWVREKQLFLSLTLIAQYLLLKILTN